MAKIYTKTGDRGETSLSDGSRVSKRHPRITAFNNIDEANSMIGMARSAQPKPSPRVDKILERIQQDLFVLGADLANPGSPSGRTVSRITEAHVKFLERTIDACQEKLAPLKNFVLPGGAPAAATLHMARALVRRAERKVIDVDQVEKLRPEVLQYANRVSDCLFVLARLINLETGTPETLWKGTDESQEG